MELTINNKVYNFKAGMGFLRKANKLVTKKVDGTKKEKEIGMAVLAAGLIDGDVEDLLTVLNLTNEGQDPRVTMAELEGYIEDESTDIDALFESVLDFLSSANVCKKTIANLKERIAEQQAKTQA